VCTGGYIYICFSRKCIYFSYIFCSCLLLHYYWIVYMHIYKWYISIMHAKVFCLILQLYTTVPLQHTLVWYALFVSKWNDGYLFSWKVESRIKICVVHTPNENKNIGPKFGWICWSISSELSTNFHQFKQKFNWLVYSNLIWYPSKRSKWVQILAVWFIILKYS
jgi:hypothetical protein